MAAYVFETMTAEQARDISHADTLRSSGGTANATTILFLADGTYSVTIGARTLVFGPELPRLTGGIIGYPDGSILYIGSALGEAKDQGAIPSSGAMYGGDGADTLTGSPGDWLIQGNQGADRIVAWTAGFNTIYGGQDDDRISFIIGGAAIRGQFAQGNKGNDTLQGANRDDTLLGGQGADLIFGAGGRDYINGNLGNDEISGDGVLLGEVGADRITGSGTISGGDGNDDIVVGAMTGVATANLVNGDLGDDTITANSDPLDQIYGGEGNDLVWVIQNLGSGALNSQKLLDGGAGNDTLVSRAGDDSLLGGAGSDSLSGGDGGDRVDGGPGADTLSGGAGVELFVVTQPSLTIDAAGADRILDWTADDRLAFRLAGPLPYAEATAADFQAALSLAQARIGDGSAEVVAVQVGSDVVVFADAGPANTVDTVVTLVGRSLDDIAAGNIT